MSMGRILLTISLGVVFFGQPALPQVNSGTISGVVHDATGSVVPGASVTAKNIETGSVRTLTTGAEGRYQFPGLTVGKYEVQAVMSGFQTEIRTGIELTVGHEAAVNLTLQVGQVAESVEVAGEAPLVETTNAAITGLVDEKTVRDLPLNGRSLDQLVLLQVGTTQDRRSQANHATGSFQGGGAKISISGTRPQQTSFLLDGTDVNDARNVMPGSASGGFLGVETVREFRVLSNSYAAEYGRAAGGVILAVTRSGTNNLHGTAFEFLRNSALDARNFFDRGTSPPPFKRNQFGFTLGGPIKKDKTFFFGSYEGLRERLGITETANVPDAAAHQGFLPVNGVLTNVGITPGVAPWLNLYPLPNARIFGDGTGQYIFAPSQPTTENYFSGRVDQTFSEKHSLFGRYTFDNANQNAPTNLPIATTPSLSRYQYLTVQADTILSASTLNAFRFGYNRSSESQITTFTSGFPSGLTFVPGVAFAPGGGVITASGLAQIGNQRTPQSQTLSLFEWSDDVTRMWGRHTVKAGVIVKRIHVFRQTANSASGNYDFAGLGAFLQAQPDDYVQEIPGFPTDRNWRQNFVGFYGQDDLKMTPRLTLNLGVREEFMTGPNEINGRSANMPNVLMTATVVGNPFIPTFKRNVAPRVGLAWDSMGNGKMVVRGGFGIFYDQPLPNYWMVAGDVQPPFEKVAELTKNVPFPNAYAAIDPKNPTLGDLRPFNNTATTYVMQYDFTIQSQINSSTALTVGYAGSQGRHLVRTGQVNIKYPIILSNGVQFFPADAPVRNPIWGNVRMEQTDANSNYNALVVSVNKRLHGGFQLGGSYTYAKIMSEAESVYGGDSAGPTVGMDPYNLKADRAPAIFSEKHNLSVNYIYNLPLALKGAAGKALNGWQISGITRVSSGLPFSADATCCSGNGSSGRFIVERPDLVVGTNNNPVTGTTAGCAIAKAGQQLGTPDLYFDPCVFRASVPGFYGTLGRNTLIGPGLVNFDFALLKNTAITEKLNLQFRAEFFNLFNRANFGTPGGPSGDVLFTKRGSNPSDTVITNTDTTSRQIQFSLKLIF